MRHEALASIISQQELDRLSAALGETVALKGDGETVEVTLYDFRRAYRLSGTQVEQVRRDCQRIATALSRALSGFLGAEVAVDFVTLDRMMSRQWMSTVRDDAVITSFAVTTDGPPALVQLDRGVLSAAVDMMLGGSGAKPRHLGDPLSSIELQLHRHLIGEILSVARLTSETFSEVGEEQGEVFTHPFTTVPLEEDAWMLSAGYNITVGCARGMLSLGLPSASVQRVLSREYRSRLSDRESREAVMDCVAPCAVDIDAVLARTCMKISDISRICVGDVINLHIRQSAIESIDVVIAGKRKFVGRPGIQDGKLAVRIEDEAPIRCGEPRR